jgi:antitoxin component YwqK of YwqJK toxin-antitoxin module
LQFASKCSIFAGFKHSVMKKAYIIFLLLYITFSAHSQVTQNDGYYFLDGKLYTGISEQTNDQGEVIAKVQVKNGLPDGISEYFSGGLLVEKRAYRNGDKHGVWEKFENGKKVSEAVYHKDKKHGKWYIWDATGTLRYEMHYKKGKKIGVWKMWDENGQLISEKTY